MKNYWKSIEKVLKKYWKSIEKVLKKYWKSIEKVLKKYWKIWESISKASSDIACTLETFTIVLNFYHFLIVGNNLIEEVFSNYVCNHFIGNFWQFPLMFNDYFR